MKKHFGKRILILLLALAILMSCAIGGTIAWLLVKTEPIVNTFTAGKIDLTLAEPHWQTNFVRPEGPGAEDDVPAFKCMPGDLIPKDPTVTIGANSVDCYVRLFVVIWWQPGADSRFAAADSDAWFRYEPHSEYTGWWVVKEGLYDTTNHHVLGIVKELRYNEKITTSNQDQSLRPLFDYIQVPTNLETDDFLSLDNFKLIVFAQAVQATGFQNADEAFAQAGLPEITLQDCKDANGNAQTLEQIIDVLQRQNELFPDDENN